MLGLGPMVLWTGLTGWPCMNSSEAPLWEKFYTVVEDVQENFDQWIQYYHFETLNRGYWNMRKRLIETIKEGNVLREKIEKQAV